MAERSRVPETLLGTALQRIAESPTGPGLPDALGVFISGVGDAVQRGRIEEVVRAIVTVTRLEAALPEGDARRGQYGIALRRVFTPETLRAAAKLLLNPFYNRDVLELMTRAGATATEQLLDLLITAPTPVERRALLEALRGIKDGTELLVAMLDHPEWFVVRNVADLVGELRVEEGTDRLGKAAEHDDARVRRSAGVALARLGTPAAVRHLRKVLRDTDGQVRLETAKAIGPNSVAGLAPLLAGVCEAETAFDVRAEIYRALGRIGTAEAVQVLKKAAEPGGRIFGRRASGPRLAAIEGLALAGGEMAVAILRTLVKDRDKGVRVAATAALSRRPTTSAPRIPTGGSRAV